MKSPELTDHTSKMTSLEGVCHQVKMKSHALAFQKPKKQLRRRKDHHQIRMGLKMVTNFVKLTKNLKMCSLRHNQNNNQNFVKMKVLMIKFQEQPVSTQEKSLIKVKLWSMFKSCSQMSDGEHIIPICFSRKRLTLKVSTAKY